MVLRGGPLSRDPRGRELLAREDPAAESASEPDSPAAVLLVLSSCRHNRHLQQSLTALGMAALMFM